MWGFNFQLKKHFFFSEYVFVEYILNSWFVFETITELSRASQQLPSTYTRKDFLSTCISFGQDGKINEERYKNMIMISPPRFITHL